MFRMGFPGGSDSKESACNAGDSGWIPGLGRFPEGNDYPLQYSYLENPMDKGAWQATVPWGHKESDISEQLNLFLFFTLNSILHCENAPLVLV